MPTNPIDEIQFLRQRLDIAESDMSQDEKRAALAALKAQQAAQQRRAGWVQLVLWLVLLAGFVVTVFVVLRGMG